MGKPGVAASSNFWLSDETLRGRWRPTGTAGAIEFCMGSGTAAIRRMP